MRERGRVRRWVSFSEAGRAAKEAGEMEEGRRDGGGVQVSRAEVRGRVVQVCCGKRGWMCSRGESVRELEEEEMERGTWTIWRR